jgi:hypothetical protein
MSLIDLHPDAPRGRSPTRVTVHSRHPGHQLTESQALELDQVYTQFCNIKNTSMGGFHSDEFTLSDGTVVQITSVNGNDEVDVYPSDKPTLFPQLISGIGLLLTDEFNNPLEGYTTEDDQVQPVVLEFGEKGSIKIRKPPKILGGDLMWVDAQRKFWTAASRLQAYACQGNDTIGAVRTPLESPVFRYPGAEPGTRRIGYFGRTGLGALVFRSGEVQPAITGLDTRTIISSDYLDDTEQTVTIPGGYTVSGVISPSPAGTQAVALGQSPGGEKDRAILFRITEAEITAELLNLGGGGSFEVSGRYEEVSNYASPVVTYEDDYDWKTIVPADAPPYKALQAGQYAPTYTQDHEHVASHTSKIRLLEEELLSVRFSRRAPFIQKGTRTSDKQIGPNYTETDTYYQSTTPTGAYYRLRIPIGDPDYRVQTENGAPKYAPGHTSIRLGPRDAMTHTRTEWLGGVGIVTQDEVYEERLDSETVTAGSPSDSYYSVTNRNDDALYFATTHNQVLFRDADRPCSVTVKATNTFLGDDIDAAFPRPVDFDPEDTAATRALVIRVGNTDVLEAPLPGLKARITGELIGPGDGDASNTTKFVQSFLPFLSTVGPLGGTPSQTAFNYYESGVGFVMPDPGYNPYDPDRPSGQRFPLAFIPQGASGFTTFYAVDPITLALVIMVKYSGNGVPADANDWAYVVSDAGTQPLAEVLGLPEGTRIQLVSDSQNSLKSI